MFCLVIWYLSVDLDYMFSRVFFMVTSLALGQSYDCPSAGEVTMKNMGKFDGYWNTTKHNKVRIVHMFPGMYIYGIAECFSNLELEISSLW